MRKTTEYSQKRYPLEKERMRLLELLENQGDFPDYKLVDALENNKRQLVELDAQYQFYTHQFVNQKEISKENKTK
jgi:hypothetical protein